MSIFIKKSANFKQLKTLFKIMFYKNSISKYNYIRLLDQSQTSPRPKINLNIFFLSLPLTNCQTY